jgi:hypothetical protein
VNLKTAAAGLVSSVALAAGATLVVVGPAEAGAKNTLFINPGRPIANENFTATGTLSTPIKRKAVLQLVSAGQWKSVDTDTTSSSGVFNVSSHTAVDREFRIIAPKTTIGGKTYPQITGLTKTVDVVTQTAVVTVSNTSPEVGEVVQIVGRFTPTRKGRAVRAYVRANGTSYGLGTRAQSSKGLAVWYVTTEASDVGVPAQFYVRAMESNGAAELFSTRVDVTAIP